METILVKRDQFDITPQGIVHKPTNTYFAPHVGDPYSGSIHLGQLANAVPVSEHYDLDEVKKMMMQLWAEYVAVNFNQSH